MTDAMSEVLAMLSWQRPGRLRRPAGRHTIQSEVISPTAVQAELPHVIEADARKSLTTAGGTFPKPRILQRSTWSNARQDQSAVFTSAVRTRRPRQFVP